VIKELVEIEGWLEKIGEYGYSGENFNKEGRNQLVFINKLVMLGWSLEKIVVSKVVLDRLTFCLIRLLNIFLKKILSLGIECCGFISWKKFIKDIRSVLLIPNMK
jgi:hypothetical protein